MPTFSDRLKELRKTRNATQKQMAELLGIAERNYRRYEAGEVDPTATNASKLADYFGVSVDYLLGRTDHWYDTDGNITIKISPGLPAHKPSPDE